MKTNPNHPLAQCKHQDGSFITRNSFTEHGNADDFYVLGLTKREHMAIEFTKAFIGIQYSSTETCVEMGIDAADRLIKALNK